MWELNEGGESVLHLCCGWPEGMAFLLERGAEPLIHRSVQKRRPSVDPSLPLFYAVACNCAETVSILLQNGSPLCIEGLWPKSLLEQAIDRGNSEIINLIIEALVDRRRRLKDFATLSLPPRIFQKLNLHSDRLIDGQAALLQEVLFGHHVSKAQLPPSLAVSRSRTTIYHHTNMTPELAERLYNVGFKDVNCPDYLGYTPLGAMDFSVYSKTDHYEEIEIWLEYAAWLISKQPGALRSVQEYGQRKTRPTAAHRLSYYLGSHFSPDWYWSTKSGPVYTLGFLNQLRRASTPFNILREILAVDVTDKCTCACSHTGCLPLTSMLKALEIHNRWFKSVTQQSPSWYLNRRLPFVKWLCSSQDSNFVVPLSVWIDVVRLETFNSLGMTHICCHCDSYSRVDNAEAKEIQEEEADSSNQLEALMSEFEAELLQEHQSIVKFMDGYWKQRMSEVLSGQGQTTLQPEDRTKIRDMGIILELDPDTLKSPFAKLDSAEEPGFDRSTRPTHDGDPSSSNEIDKAVLSDSDDEFFELDEDSGS